MPANPSKPIIPAVQADAIPAELRERDQWVCWHYVWQNERWTKVPRQSWKRSVHAKSNDPTTWGPFAQALATHQRVPTYGVSFALTAGDPYCGIDLDHVLAEDGTITDPLAAEIVETFASYTEVTPSGDGLRVWVRGVLPPGKRRTGCVELYDTARIFTVTGQRWRDTPGTIQPRQAELEALHARLFPPQDEPGTVPGPSIPVSLGDQALLDKARTAKNGAQFSALYDRGDCSAYARADGGWDRSSADQALCNLLAFWCGNDPGRMDALFRGSALMRKKWDERHSGGGQTYGAMTLASAIANSREVYTGTAPQPPAPQAGPSAPPRPETGDGPPVAPPPIQIANNRQQWVTVPAKKDGGDEKQRPVYAAVPAQEILAQVLTVTEGWPRRIGDLLFHDAAGEIQYLDSPAALCAWLMQYAELSWRKGQDEYNMAFVAKDELLHYCKLRVLAYDDIDVLPHVPELPGHYYAWRPLPDYTPDGRYLEQLLDFFTNVETPEDRALIKAMFVTPAWGGPLGKRPIFAVMASDRGCGKTTLTDMVGKVYGGLVEYAVGKKAEEDLVTRLLDPGSRTKRIVRLDNIKGELSSALIEGLVTAPHISGRQLYRGDGARPNTLMWLLTGNGLRLSRDIAERCFIIKLTKPAYNPRWEHEVDAFIEQHRQHILMDICHVLQAAVQPSGASDRWALFVDEVLSRCTDDPRLVVGLNQSRRTGCDEDLEEAEIMLESLLRLQGEYVGHEGYYLTRDAVVSAVNEALGLRLTTRGVMARLRQHIEADHFGGVLVEHKRNGCRGFVVYKTAEE